jgi:lipid-A-disaccharide synthase
LIGDLIGAKLVSALKAKNSDIQIEGMAGERMLEAGCVQLWDTVFVQSEN